MLHPDHSSIRLDVVPHGIAELADPAVIFLKGHTLVPLHLRDRVGIGDFRKPGTRHKQEKGNGPDHGKGEKCPPRGTVAETPHCNLLISLLDTVEGELPEQRMRLEPAFLPIGPPVVDRNHGDSDEPRCQKNCGDRDGLVMEKSPRSAVQENQGDEYGARRQHRAEHRPSHLLCSLQHSRPQVVAAIPARSDIVYQHNGIVRQHSYS